MLNERVRPPIWFWVICAIALLWYLMDMSAFVMRVFMAENFIASMPENQQRLYQSMPHWVNIVFAAEVFGGLLGCLALLLRKKWALPLLVLSIAGVLAQTFYVYFLSNAIEVMGSPAIVMPLVAIVIGLVMIFVARMGSAKNWLN